MRIKFLSVIVSFLLVSFAITSCLDNNEATGDYSTDATIHAFAIDTIFGENYAFTIDQIKGQIYNMDSLPVGSDTIIDRVLIKTLNTNSGIVTMLNKTGEDSVINIADSMDLRKPIDVKVWSAEGYVLLSQGASKLEYEKFVKNYRIEVRVHQQDPDTLNWGSLKDEKPIATSFSEGTITGKQKAVILKTETTEDIFVYSKNSNNALIAYKASVKNGSSWQSVGVVTGFPSTAFVDLSSILTFGNRFYAVASGEVYFSENGVDWELNQPLNQDGYSVHTLLAAYPAPKSPSTIDITTGIAAVLTYDLPDAAGTRTCFAITNDNATEWKLGKEVPEGFPNYDISSTVYINDIGVQGAMLMGSDKKRAEEEVKKPIIPWGSYDGQSWADLSTINAFCPILPQPSILYYGDDFYAFGNDFNAFYTSENAIAWYETGKKFYFPAGLKARTGSNYSMVVDSKNFIWIICSKSSTGDDDVWRARLNKLGFVNTITQ